MKAKLTSIQNGVTRHCRDLVDTETWIPERIKFLTDSYKFDDFKVETNESNGVITLYCHRNQGKPRTNGKAMDVTFQLTIVESMEAKVIEVLSKETIGFRTEQYNNNVDVYTKHAFVTYHTLTRWKEATGASDIQISFRYDREDGLVYTFKF